MGFPDSTRIDLRTGDAERDDPANAQSWGSDRIIRAQVVLDLLLGNRAEDERYEQGKSEAPAIFISGARITGQLDLRGLDARHSLLLQECALDEPLVLADSTCRSIRLLSCHLPGVVGAWLVNEGDLHLRACDITGMVDLSGAYIGRRLVLSASRLSNPGGVAVSANGLVVGGDLLCRDNAVIEGEASLVAARVEDELRIENSMLLNPSGVALRADHITVEKDMYCREGFTADGEIRLRGGHFKGQLNLNTATMRNPGQIALDAANLTVENNLSCDEGFTAVGMVILADAEVGGKLSFSGATLTNPGRVALLAPRLTVDRDMLCRYGFTADGTLCVVGARIDGMLSFTGARLTGACLTDDQLADTGIVDMLADHGTPGHVAQPGNESFARRAGRPGATSRASRQMYSQVRTIERIVTGESGMAFLADGLRVNGDLACDAFSARGEVRLRGARIARNLDFTDAEVNNKDGTALNAADLEAERVLLPAKCEAGKISLRYAKITDLDDKQGVLPDQIDILGLSYETLIPPIDPQRRLEWMRLAGRYEPQVYDQLARSYRRLGYDERARTVELAQQRRRRATLPLVRRWWGYLQDATIGYGYRPMRASALLAIVVVVGVAFFGTFPPLPANPYAHATFNPFMFTLDVLIPFGDFGQRAYWTPPLFRRCSATLLHYRRGSYSLP